MPKPGPLLNTYAIITCLVLLLGHALAQSPFTGVWTGSVALPNGELAIEVTLDLDADPPSGVIDIPAQGAHDLVLSEIVGDGNAVSFAIRDVPGGASFAGELADGRIEGVFTQGGAIFPFGLAPATQGAAITEDGEYTDPEGFYAVPVPVNWTAAPRDGYSVLTSPEGRIEVFTLSVATADLDAGVARAWELVDPDFPQVALQTLSVPAPAGIDAVRLVVYQTAPDRLAQAAVRAAGARVYVTIFTGEVAAAMERQSQIAIIDGGFRILGVDAEDISGRPAGALTPEIVTQLEEFIRDAMERADVPGLAISIVRDGEIAYANGFGVRELGADELVTPETLMMIGSTGKTMTTLLMAALVDEGVMTWETPVSEILPEFRFSDPELTHRITVRHLVCACTGVPRRDLEMIFNADELTAEGVIDSLADFRLFTAVGEAFQYSNQMVAAGGYVAAAADGAAYGELFDGWLRSMDQRVFDPIGMDDTLVRFEDVLARDDVATPHAMNLDMSYRPIDIAMERFVLPVAPAGAPWSNVMDMGRYLLTQLALGVAPDGTRVVSEANLRRTWQPEVPLSADMDYALGWMIGDYKGLGLITHGGNTVGYTSELTFLPTEGIGISILTNASGTNAVGEAIRTRLFELLYGLEPEAPELLAFALDNRQRMLALIDQDFQPLKRDVVEAYLGSYENADLGEIVLRLDVDTLLVDVGEFAAELRARDVDGAKYVATTPPFPGLEFGLEQRDGVPVVVLSHVGGTYTFTRSRP